MGKSSATALKTNIESMKLFVVLALASVALGGMDYEMTQKWQKLKAMEGCWGEENMKIVMVDMKKAIAKCSHEDAPELSLPPYRSAYRFTNTMINKGDQYENVNEMATLFAKMMSEHKQQKSNPFSSFSGNSNHGVRRTDKMEMMKMMMKMMKMSQMINDNDYSPSTYSSDNAFDMFSDMFDGSDRMDSYRTPEHKNTRTCSTPCASRGPLVTTLTLETGSSRSWPSRGTTWRPRSAT